MRTEGTALPRETRCRRPKGGVEEREQMGERGKGRRAKRWRNHREIKEVLLRRRGRGSDMKIRGCEQEDNWKEGYARKLRLENAHSTVYKVHFKGQRKQQGGKENMHTRD